MYRHFESIGFVIQKSLYDEIVVVSSVTNLDSNGRNAVKKEVGNGNDLVLRISHYILPSNIFIEIITKFRTLVFINNVDQTRYPGNN